MYVCMYVSVFIFQIQCARAIESWSCIRKELSTLGATEHRRLLTMLLTDREGHTRVSRDIFAFLYRRKINRG